MGAVRYLPPPGLDRTVAWQRYYLLGLDEVARLRWDGPPRAARLLPRVDDKVRLVYRLDGRGPGKRAQGFVGRYVAELSGTSVRFAVDAHDARHVRDEDALRWSDVYFKSNCWAADDYDSKIAPVVNGNGLLNRRRIEHLRRLRGTTRDVDVAFITNFHGGRPHVFCLFEELMRLDARCDLLAVFDGADPEDDRRWAARLRDLGVPVATEPLPPESLWARLARARTVLVRAGRHACVPWRMLDLLGMGACIVLDAPFPAEWPVALRDGVECANCRIERPLDGTAAPAGEYAKLGTMLVRLLGQPNAAAALREGASRYFDEHAAPGRVGAYLLETCAERLSIDDGVHKMEAR